MHATFLTAICKFYYGKQPQICRLWLGMSRVFIWFVAYSRLPDLRTHTHPHTHTVDMLTSC